MTGTRRRGDLDLERVDSLLAAVRPSAAFRLDRPVDLHVITTTIADAVAAAASGRPERWRWVVVEDPVVRAGVAALHRRDVADDLDHLVDAAPILVVACHLGRPEPAGRLDEVSGFFCDAVPAVTGFVEAAARHGLATTVTTRHLAREADVAQLLGIPRNVSQIALIPVAVGADEGAAGRTPVPFDARSTHVNHWAG